MKQLFKFMGTKAKLPDVLPSPGRHPDVPLHAKWLSGEGAGSWFAFEAWKNSSEAIITRYSPEGKQECKGHFIAAGQFDFSEQFEVIYPANCSKITILQKNDQLLFNREETLP